MALWYYYDNNGIKRGPVNDEQLRSLADNGTINQGTILETDTGKQGLAKQVGRLFTRNHEESEINIQQTNKKFCPHCGNVVPANAVICPQCANSTNAARSYKKTERNVNTTLPLVFSILLTLCCGGWLLGIIAIIFSCLGMGAANRGDWENAAGKVKVANILNVINLIFMVIAVIVLVIIFFSSISAAVNSLQY